MERKRKREREEESVARSWSPTQVLLFHRSSQPGSQWSLTLARLPVRSTCPPPPGETQGNFIKTELLILSGQSFPLPLGWTWFWGYRLQIFYIWMWSKSSYSTLHPHFGKREKKSLTFFKHRKSNYYSIVTFLDVSLMLLICKNPTTTV